MDDNLWLDGEARYETSKSTDHINWIMSIKRTQVILANI